MKSILNPDTILDKWLGLLLPSSIGITLIVLSVFLRVLGLEPLGTILTSLVNFWSELTNAIALATKDLVVWLIVFSTISVYIRKFLRDLRLF